ncbi:DUF3276 family protein [Lunatibacter salilacus]|uniref:DUF3276 family protein n=1 Tax=Lunatibacter salilacus TaxID=2483804 RepID=UPI00131C43F7|nr:DUF3276 family protein [Lunatibacter salilacus]
MSGKKIIESIKIPAKKRTYFVEVKETREGAKFLKIIESKQLDDGEFEQYRIMVFEDDINDIVKALRIALKHFPTYKKPEQKSKMAQTKERFTNAYKPWTNQEDLKLTELFCQGRNSKEISEILQRNEGAINSRIEKLDLKQKYG